MPELKPISIEAVPAALAKAERYRLLNEPSEAESICRDVLRADSENQEALIMLLLSLTDEFDAFVSGMMALEKKDNPFSSYYLITRLAYSWYAKEMDEPIDYNHPLHRVAPMLPSLGDYGPLKLRVYRKI